MSQSTLESPLDVVRFQLRTALTMEDDSLAMLGELAEAAESAEVRKMFTHHADETREQIENLHRVFELLELPRSTAASPTTKGLARQGAGLVRRSESAVRDAVVLSAALGTEHYEIAAYQALLVPVTRLGVPDASSLLQDNLDQETHTSEELHSMLQKVAG